MSCTCRIITLGKINGFLILILIGAILLGSLSFVESLTKFFAEKNYHPIIYTMTYSLGLTLSFCFLLVHKKRIKSEKENQLINCSTIERANTYTCTMKKITFKEKFLWILLTASINYFAYAFFCICWMNPDNYLNCWGITISFMSLFSHFILKMKIYRHHYLGMICIITFGISYNVAMGMFSKENLKKNYNSYLIQLMTECLICLTNVLYKFLMDKKYIISYEILVYEGIIEFILGVIILIITTSLNYLDNFWDFVNDVDATEIALLVLLTLIQFLLYLSQIIVIDKFSPFHVFLITVIRDLIFFFAFFRADKLAGSIYVAINILACLFILLIFTEIIEINFLDLSIMTKKNIELRALIDASISEKEEEEDIEDKKINYEGYEIDFRNEKSNEPKELIPIDMESSN